MHLTVRSVERMRRGHDHLLANTQREVVQGLGFIGRFAKDHVQKHPEFRPRTGALQRSVKARVVRTSGGKLLKLGSNKKYAQSIDGGARPHVIRPKRRQFLRFKGRNGQWVFARKVNHPGNKPYKFLYRATKAAGRVGERNLRQRLSRIASRF
jgi:hypothetical protein